MNFPACVAVRMGPHWEETHDNTSLTRTSGGKFERLLHSHTVKENGGHFALFAVTGQPADKGFDDTAETPTVLKTLRQPGFPLQHRVLQTREAF